MDRPGSGGGSGQHIDRFLPAAGAYFQMAGTGLAMDRMAQVIFIGIASVTYPHVAVIAMAQRNNVLGKRHLMLPV